MAGELVDVLRPQDFFNESGVNYDTTVLTVKIGSVRALVLPMNSTTFFNLITAIPANLTMGTGLTFYLLFTDDGLTPADLGKIIDVGIAVKRLINDETIVLTTGGGTEQTTTVTLSAAAGGVAIGTLAIANADLDSAVVGDQIAIRFRRIGADGSDTCDSRVLFLGGHIKNT